jgi:hypothetical protein
MTRLWTAVLLVALAGCSPYPEIGNRPQAQTHGNWSSGGNIVYGQHKGGAMPGQVWVVDPLKAPEKP